MKYKKIIIAGALLATTMSCGKKNDDATTSASSEENNEQGTAGASKKAGALKSDFEEKFKELRLALASVVVKDDQLPVYTITDKFVKAKEGEPNTKYSFATATEFAKSEDLKFAQDAVTCIVRTAFLAVPVNVEYDELKKMLCLYDKDKTHRELTKVDGGDNIYRYLSTNSELVLAQYYRFLLTTRCNDVRNINKLMAKIKTSNDTEALKQLGDSLTVEKLIPGICKLTSKDLKIYPDKSLEGFMSKTMLDILVPLLTREASTSRQGRIATAMNGNGTKQSEYVGDGGFGYVPSRNNDLPARIENTYKSYKTTFMFVVKLMKEVINSKIKMIDAKSTKAGSKQ